MLSNEIKYALNEIGYNADLIDSRGREKARIVHDLGIYGDDFDDFCRILADDFGIHIKVDGKYIPPEALGFLESLLNFPKEIMIMFGMMEKFGKVPPLTLGEIDKMIESAQKAG